MRLLMSLVVVVGCAAALAALPPGDDPPRFGLWSAPVNLGPVVNASGPSAVAYDACPTISKDGLSLFFRSNRPGGYGSFDIWVTQRDTLEAAWGAPTNLGPTVNTAAGEYCSTFSPDGHWMVFVRDAATGQGYGSQDLWISHRKDRRDDFGWEVPQNLGPLVNSSAQENGPAWFDDEANGRTLLYFTSGRAGTLDIYLSEAVGDEKGNFGAPSPVVELNTPYTDYQPVLRKDGLEIFFASSRPGSMTYTAPNGTIYRYPDLWTSTRANTLDPWSPPVNLGPVVNSDQFDFHPTLSWDGTTLIFASERLGPSAGWADLFVSTRVKLVGPQ